MWDCPFDREWCDITQDQSDDFDWTLHHGSTPSDNTGPERAHSDNYYIYIEASEPREKNDYAV